MLDNVTVIEYEYWREEERRKLDLKIVEEENLGREK